MTPPNDMPADTELREFIESWIPINVKDAHHVKVAKIEARDEFMQLIKQRDTAIRKEAEERGFTKGYSECMKEWQTS